MKKSKIPFITIGIPSLFLIFLVLCLAVFSVLSLSSAVADQKLSQKTADRTSEYYKASNEANDTLTYIDQILTECYQETKDKKTYYQHIETSLLSNPNIQFSQKGEAFFLSWNTAINDSQVLSVQLSLPYPIEEGETFYEIKQCQVINTEEWTPDQSQHVYQPNKEGK